MAVCLDASAAVAAFMPDPARPQAREFVLDCLSQGETLVGPPLLLAETTSVLRRYAYRKVISAEEAAAALRDFLDLPIVLVETSELYSHALEIASRLGHGRAYDAQYLAVSRFMESTLVTLDGGLYTNAGRLGIPAHLIV